MALVVHGGAGNIPEGERPAHRAGLERALNRGWRRLEAGASAIMAVEAAVVLLEDDPTFDAGFGSVLRLDGSVSLDASIMEGERRLAGAVAGLSRVRHPISLARHVLENTPHVFMISAGAEALAEKAGIELCEPGELVTDRERKRLERLLESRPEPGPAGTVGAVARDRHGHIAAATSTGGAPGSLPGRVGDSPIIGAGTIADDRHGGVSSTGQGENIIRVSLARVMLQRLGTGVSASQVVEWALEHLRQETGSTCGVICIDVRGETGAAYSTAWMGSLERTEKIP